MNIFELECAVNNYIDNLNLKSPRTRKSQAKKIIEFIRTNPILINNKDVVLPSDKNTLVQLYTKWKGCTMNGAEKSALNHIYECYSGSKTTIVESRTVATPTDNVNRKKEGEIEARLIEARFLSVNSISAELVPELPGLYCIKLREGVRFPKDFGPIREDGIIYIGKSESSTLRKRLWEEELNYKRPATFFRSIGAMLGYLPPKGSLFGKSTRNYKFSNTDEEKIRQWMKSNLLVNCIPVDVKFIEKIEKELIGKYCPLVNIKDNPSASDKLKNAREVCIAYAKSGK